MEISLSRALSELQPLDVILVHGKSLFSTLITYTQAFELGCPPNDSFSHVGIVVSRDIIDDPLLEKGVLYIWESCLSHGVKSVHHPDRKNLGSQVRPLKEAIIEYITSLKSKVGVLTYANRRDEHFPEFTLKFRREFTSFFKAHNNVCYDANPFSLCGAVFRKLRPVAHLTKIMTGTDRLMFCSELVSTTLVWCKIFPSTIKPDCVLPNDFLGYDNELSEFERIPYTIFNPVAIITLKADTRSRDVVDESSYSTDDISIS